jgi:hypothetical protein
MDAILLSARPLALENGLDVISGKQQLVIGDPKIYLEAATLLVATVRLIFDLIPKHAEVAPAELAALARSRLAEECERLGIKSFALEDLVPAESGGRKLIHAKLDCEDFGATVKVDDLGNVTFSDVKLKRRK